jgi:hypothetical protein
LAHAFPAFPRSLVRQSDDHEGKLPAREMDLNIDRLCLNAAESKRGDPCDQTLPLLSRALRLPRVNTR